MSEVVRGQFTIDLGRAREKLGKYQLADPYAYVLEFVQAAVLRGARSVDLFVDTDDLKMSFGGEPFQVAELHNLEMAVLDDARTDAERSRKKMAMGLLAVQSLEPVLIAIESLDGHRWEKHHKKGTKLTESGTKGKSNVIHVKMPWSFSALLDRFRKRKTLRNEEVLLLKHCAISDVGIIYNGDHISKSPSSALSEKSLAGVVLSEPNISGWGGLVPGSPAELTLVVNGVRVETTTLELGPVPFQAIVECTSLSTDISGTSVHRDAEYESVMKVVRSAREKSLALLTETEAHQYSEEIKEELFASGRLNFNSSLESYPNCLTKYPILKLSDGKDCSLADLKEIVDVSGFLPYAVEQHLHEQLEQFSGILLADHDLQVGIKALTGWTTKNVTRMLRQQVEARANQRKWRNRPAQPVLEGKTYKRRWNIDSNSARGEVGIKTEGEPPLVRIIVEGCLLCEWSPQEWPLGLEVCVEGDFVPLETYDDVLHNDMSVSVLLEVADTVRTLYEELAEQNEPAMQPILADFLRLASLPSPVRTLLDSVGVPVLNFSGLIRPREWESLAQQESSPILDVAWVKSDSEKSFSVRELREIQKKSSPLVISERQMGTLERLLGDSFLDQAGEGEEVGKVAFRLDPKELREERFLAALRKELKRATQSSELRLGGFNLSRLMLVEGSIHEAVSLDHTGGVRLHRLHPLIDQALESEQPDSALLLLLVSLLITTINRATPEISDVLEMRLQELVADCIMAGPLRNDTEQSGDPRGVIDTIDDTGCCSGWAHDPAGLGLRFYFSDPHKGAGPDIVIPLESPRQEGGHLFVLDLPPSARTGEKVDVWTCLVHPLSGELVELEGSPRAYAEPHKEPARPVGQVTEITNEGLCRGWCVDPNDPQGSPQVEFYLDGTWNEGEWIGYTMSNVDDPAVAEEVGFRGAHCFEFTIPSQYRDGLRHQLYAYGFDLEKTAGNPRLSNCPFEFALARTHVEGDVAWDLGREALEQKDLEVAVKQFRVRLNKGGTKVPDHEVWSFLGSAYSGLEQAKQAQSAFAEAVRLAPWESEHWYFYGLSKIKLENEIEALKCFRKAVELDPENLDATLEIATRSLVPHRVIRAWENLLKNKDFEDHALAYNELVNLHLKSGNFGKANEVVSKARLSGFQQADDLVQLIEDGKLNRLASLPAETEKRSAQEEELELFDKAREALTQKSYETALRLLKGIAARKQFPGDLKEFWLEVSRANIGLRRFEQAHRSLTKALIYGPSSAIVLCEIGDVLDRLERPVEALQKYREAAEAEPELSWVHLRLAEVLIASGDKKGGVQALEACLENDKSGEFERVKETLMDLYAELGV